jgi:hypothetical protein
MPRRRHRGAPVPDRPLRRPHHRSGLPGAQRDCGTSPRSCRTASRVSDDSLQDVKLVYGDRRFGKELGTGRATCA